MNNNKSCLKISTITPVYAGAEYLTELVTQIDRVRYKWCSDNAPFSLTEAIFVDDAAVDDSSVLLDQLAKAYPWIKVLHLSRNYGQHAATIAGILHSSGDWIVTLDEDLQHPPEKISDLLRNAAQSNHDLVYAKASGDVHENWIRDLGSRYYKNIMAWLTGIKYLPDFNSYRLIRGSIARAAASVCGHETYFDVALSWFSQNVGSHSMQLKDSRVINGGKSGYTFMKLLSHARRMFVSSRGKAMRYGILLGFISITLGFAIALYITLSEILDPGAFGARGWASLFASIFLLGGISIFLLGIMMEYLMVLVLHAQGKPVFFTIDRSSDQLLKTFFKV